MKHFSLILVLLVVVACSSKEPKKEVQTAAQTYEPVVDQDAQVARLVGMIQADKDIEQERKDDLIKLVNEQSVKLTEAKKKQSQLRALLIDQLLKSSDGTNTQAMATTKELENLNKQNIRGLNDFILKFKSLSGQRDVEQTDLMMQAGSINFL